MIRAPLSTDPSSLTGATIQRRPGVMVFVLEAPIKTPIEVISTLLDYARLELSVP